VPSPTTALQIIEDACGLTNSIGVDQTLTAKEVSDGLRKFNDVLEEGSLYSQFVYGQANQTFATVATQASYTIGPAGNWNTVRPVTINEPAYATVQGISFPYRQVNQQQYDLIWFKAQPGGGTDVGQCFLYVNEDPLGIVTLWPVPSAVFSITFSIDRVLSAVTNAAATITFPPGYAKAFTYKLGVELAPLFGKKMTNYPDVAQIQRETWGSVKRANRKPPVMQYDSALLTHGWRNWRSWP